MTGPRKDQMHPEDMRNLLIFFVIATVLYLAYSHFILKPKNEALRQQRQVERAEQAQRGNNEIKILSRDEAMSGGGRIPISNGEIFGSVSLKGGRIDDIALQNYYETLEREENVAVLSPVGTNFPRYVDYGWVSGDQNIKVPDAQTVWQAQSEGPVGPGSPVRLTWDNGSGLIFERTISLNEDYVFKIIQTVRNESGRSVTLYPYGLVSQSGIPDDYRKIWFMHEGPLGWMGDELHEVTYKDLTKNTSQTFRGKGGWAGVTDKYWLTALIPPQLENVKYSTRYEDGETRGGKVNIDSGRYQIDFVGAAQKLSPGQSAEVTSYVYTGAKRVLKLSQYSKSLGVPNLDLAVDFGWLWFLSKPFFYALHYLHDLVGNMGIAIILLTIAIRSAVFPLTNVSYRSFAKMKKVSPQVAALRERHGDDKQALQKELVKMYEKEGVNPMAGCLPMLVQIPIFFALYKTFFTTIEMRHAPFFGWIKDLSAPDPTSIFNLFGLIPWDPPSFLHIGVWPCLMLLVMLVQRNLNPPPQDPIQRDMARFFPFIITYVLSRFGAGLVIYWTFSALIGVIQQMIIMRSLGVPIHLFGETKEEKELEEAIDKGPAVHPLIEMAEDDVEEALFGDRGEDKPKKISPPKRKKGGKGKKKKK